MDLLCTGILIGLGVTIMVGPIFFTIVDSSLNQGWRAGVSAGLGMWFSDLVFIGVTYFATMPLIDYLQSGNVELWLSIIGGVLLMSIGAALWLKRKAERPANQERPRKRDLAGHWVRGFLVNTMSPFSVFFWTSCALAFVHSRDLDMDEAAPLYIGIMLAIILGDLLKAFFAHKLAPRASSKQLQYVRMMMALLFVGSGMFFIVRLGFI